MEPSELPTGDGERREIRCERNPRQLALEVRGVALAIVGMMQQRVNVMEDVFLGDGVVGVTLAEFGDGGVYEV